MLNLVRGRRSFYCRLDKEASIVEFGLGGDKFFMVMDEKVSVHEAEDARLVLEMGCGKRVLCAAPGTVSLSCLIISTSYKIYCRIEMCFDF